jgi:hypothetical protein
MISALNITRIATLVSSIVAVRSVLAHPGSGIVVDAQGNVYFTDTGAGIWKIDAQRRLSQVPGSAFHWMAIDERGGFADVSENFGEWFERASTRGSKPTLILCSDYPCAVGPDGNLYFADTLPFFSDNPKPTLIVRRTPDGNQTVLSSGRQAKSNADPSAPPLGHVTGMAAGGGGSLYIMQSPPDSNEHVILKLTMDGEATVFASGFLNENDGVELQPGVSKTYCRGLAVDARGDVYVAVNGGRRVVKVTPQGKASDVLRSENPWSPTGIAVLDDAVYVLEYTDFQPGWNSEDRRGWIPRVRTVSRDGKVETLATIDRKSDE